MSVLAVTMYCLQRLREPSSWAGVAALLGLLGVHIDSGTAQALAGVAAGVAYFLPERDGGQQ